MCKKEKERVIPLAEYLARLEQGVFIGDCWVDMGNGEFAYALHEVVVVARQFNKYGDKFFDMHTVNICVADNTRMDTRQRDVKIRARENAMEMDRKKKELVAKVKDIVNKYYDNEIKQFPEQEVLLVSGKLRFNRETITKDRFYHYDFPPELMSGTDGEIIKKLITISGGNFTDEDPYNRHYYLRQYETYWNERWGEFDNILGKISYSIANDVYVVLQVLTDGYFGTVRRTNELTGGIAYRNINGSTNYSPIDNLISSIALCIPVYPKVLPSGAVALLVTSSKGFLFGGIKTKLPFDIPVQRFGDIHLYKIDHWGLKMGSSKIVRRVPYAIKTGWNSLTQYSTGYIPKGTSIEFGIVGPQYPLYHTGGGIQILVESNAVRSIQTVIP
jgi:hypothetical protein